jgi:hypothetical protein
MAFEKGNKLGQKSRAFDAALRRAIAQDDGLRLRQSAEKLLDLASEGERWAVEMLADRLDGKAHQSVSVEAKDLEGMSLADLRSAVAEAIAGSGQEAGGGAAAGPVH